MKFLLISTISLLSFSTYAATWKKVTGGPIIQNCPDNYILVPALSPYTTRDFCVMKYEAKQDSYGVVQSTYTGLPWTGINRATARSKCQNLGSGHDLISNDQWQTIARNIAGVKSNWSGGALASGQLNAGHSDNAPPNSLAAAALDSDPCNGTGETCSSSDWNSQRRTHKLTNGKIIWDLAGNVWEWLSNDSGASNGADQHIALLPAGDIRQTRYGADPATLCTTPADVTNNWCGMGDGFFVSLQNTVVRGGTHTNIKITGIFATRLNKPITDNSDNIGFRCVFVR